MHVRMSIIGYLSLLCALDVRLYSYSYLHSAMCMYKCLYVYMHTHIYTHTHTFASMYAYPYMHMCIFNMQTPLPYKNLQPHRFVAKGLSHALP